MPPPAATGSRFATLPPDAEATTPRPPDSAGTIRARLRRKPPKVIVVSDVKSAQRATRDLARQATIGVDLEGVLLSRTGTIELVQACTPSTTYLFDLHGELADQIFDAGGLRRLLERPSTIKVVHDCRHDCDALYHQHKVRMAPVIDTQVAFGELRALRGQPVGLPVSLRTVLRKYANVKEEAALELKLAVKKEMSAKKDYWAIRPLTPQMIQYAAFDVQHLVRAVVSIRRAVELVDKNGWQKVEMKSAEYAAQFRDDPEGKGPEKAARFYENMARTAARERAQANLTRAKELMIQKDPLRNFVIDTTSVMCVMLGLTAEEVRNAGLLAEPSGNGESSPGAVQMRGNGNLNVHSAMNSDLSPNKHGDVMHMGGNRNFSVPSTMSNVSPIKHGGATHMGGNRNVIVQSTVNGEAVSNKRGGNRGAKTRISEAKRTPQRQPRSIRSTFEGNTSRNAAAVAIKPTTVRV